MDKLRENKFKLIGGLPSLDFVNTVGGRIASEIRDDKLVEYEDLLAWSRKAGLMGQKEVRMLARRAKEDPRTAITVLKRAVQLREAAYRLFKAAIKNGRPDPEDLKRLNQELRLAKGREILVHHGGGYHFEWGTGEVPLDQMLSILAQSAAMVLTSDQLSQVKQCGGERCGWLFWDKSRRRNRTWCDMKDCGNLAKVHRFRQRHR